MMDMVRKHCVEGSGNYTTAQACVERTHEMLRMFKKATATFVSRTSDCNDTSMPTDRGFADSAS